MRKYIILAFLSCISTTSIAIEQSAAIYSSKNAEKMAQEGKNQDAFNEIAWLLRDNDPLIQSYAKNILDKHPEIGNSRIDTLTKVRLTDLFCTATDPAEQRRATLNFIDEVAPFVNSGKIAEVIGSMPFRVELDSITSTGVPTHQPAASPVAAGWPANA